MDRRLFIQRGAMAVAAARTSRCEVQRMLLREFCSSSLRVLGGATTLPEISADSVYEGRFTSEFNGVTPAIEMKWQTLHPGPDRYAFERADRFMEWAERKRLRVHGHTLVWPSYGTPDWVKAYGNPANARTLLEEHVRSVVGRYRGRIRSWDVVNEPLNVWDKRPDLLARVPWVDWLGPEYIDLAFHAAAEADPAARLVWNQNYVESGDKGDEQNRQAFLVQLRRLTKNRVPIHAIGMQSHLFAEKPWNVGMMERFTHEVRSMGIEIDLTELDVIDTALPGDIARRDQMVADVYRRYLDMMVRLASPSEITFWTFSDRHNWLDWAQEASPKYRRGDGAAHRPGLIDAALRAKPSFDAVANVLSLAASKHREPAAL